MITVRTRTVFEPITPPEIANLGHLAAECELKATNPEIPYYHKQALLIQAEAYRAAMFERLTNPLYNVLEESDTSETPSDGRHFWRGALIGLMLEAIVGLACFALYLVCKAVL